MHNRIIDRLARQKYHTSKVKHKYHINQYWKLLNKQKHIVGCSKCDFDKILMTTCKFKSFIWIYRWTRWATRWQPAQFWRVGSGGQPSAHIWGICLTDPMITWTIGGLTTPVPSGIILISEIRRPPGGERWNAPASVSIRMVQWSQGKDSAAKLPAVQARHHASD